jgi:hypothetical protein
MEFVIPGGNGALILVGLVRFGVTFLEPGGDATIILSVIFPLSSASDQMLQRSPQRSGER